jgi:tetratricopeptide (TPR) repeat protein
MMSTSYSRSRRRSRARLCAFLGALLALGACGSRPTPAAPAPHARSTEATIEKAQQAEARRDYEAARRLYRQAADEAPDPASRAFALGELASALAFWGEIEGAVEALEESLRSRPSSVRRWHDLGILRAQLGRNEEALAALRRAVQLAPREPRSRIALAAQEVNMGLYLDARRDYQTLLDLEIPPKIAAAAREALRILDSEIEKTSPPAPKAL